MNAILIEILVMEGIAVLLFGFAYAIGVRGRMDLIAGYNARSAERVTDKKGLARLVAHCCVVVGIASALMPIATNLLSATPAQWYAWTGGYGGLVVGCIAMTMLQSRQYVSRA